MTNKPDIVILGAGILGCALAWRLAARGICPGSAILVVDPNPLASQASSRAAALLSVSRSRKKAHWIPLVRKTLAAIDDLASRGHEIPLHRCGALHLAASAEASAVLADHAAAARENDVRCEPRTLQEIQSSVPWLDLQQFDGALWFPDEAYTDPYQLASAYAAAARSLGVRFRLNTPARLRDLGASVGVELPEGCVEPGAVWVSCGAWSSRVLRPVGLAAPQAAVRSQYWISENTDLAPSLMPMVLAADLRLYARREIGALLFGLRETDGVAATTNRLPEDFGGFLFDAADPEGLATLEAFASLLERFAPGLMRTGLRHYITGPSCYTPDGEFLVGALPEKRNLRLLSGCNGAGIAVSAGLADLAADCEAGPSATANSTLARFSPARFGAFDPDAPDFLARCVRARSGKTSG